MLWKISVDLYDGPGGVDLGVRFADRNLAQQYADYVTRGNSARATVIGTGEIITLDSFEYDRAEKLRMYVLEIEATS